ncbi:RluA family pseudouridine synthase [Roseburia hominis]
MENINILYEDADIIVCVKPAGTPVQTRGFRTPDMESLLKNHLIQTAASAGRRPASANQRSDSTRQHFAAPSQRPAPCGPKKATQSGAPYLAVIHRLDQPVRGILVFAKIPSAAKQLNHQMQTGKFQKIYHALACGTLHPAQGTLCDYLVKDGCTNTSRICSSDTPGAKKAELGYRVLRELPAFRPQTVTEVEIQLKTGRHHQIRVQMAGAGAPLLYDTKYNPAFSEASPGRPGSSERCSVALCACSLSFSHPRTGKNMQFKIDCGW